MDAQATLHVFIAADAEDAMNTLHLYKHIRQICEHGRAQRCETALTYPMWGELCNCSRGVAQRLVVMHQCYIWISQKRCYQSIGIKGEAQTARTIGRSRRRVLLTFSPTCVRSPHRFIVEGGNDARLNRMFIYQKLASFCCVV